jgi:phage shock protein A
MGILLRVSTIVSATLNKWLGRAEDPAAIIEHSLVDMREQLARAKRDVAGAIADEKKLKAELEREASQADEWEQRAMLAVREGRDDLASQALAREGEHRARAKELQHAWTQQQQGAAALKKSLQSMNDKIEELKRKKNMLTARQHRAEATERMHGSMASMQDASAIETFQRMEEKIGDLERHAMAVAELSQELSGDSLDRQFKDLERGAPDQRLAQLKQRMGVTT